MGRKEINVSVEIGFSLFSFSSLLDLKCQALLARGGRFGDAMNISILVDSP